MTRSSPSSSKKREYIEISSGEEEDPASQLCVVLDGNDPERAIPLTHDDSARTAKRCKTAGANASVGTPQRDGRRAGRADGGGGVVAVHGARDERALPVDVGHGDARLDAPPGLANGGGRFYAALRASRTAPRRELVVVTPLPPPTQRFRVRSSQEHIAHAFLGQLSDGGWRDALDGEISKPYLFQLAQFVAKERKSKTVYPPPQDTFAALDACKLDDVKIVIVGQDPYHGPGQAHGLCFSIADGADCKFPPSLRNIFVELSRDLPGTTLPPKGKGDLTKWAQRGVLLLNSSLTVRKGEANSHAKAGWHTFTDAVIRTVNRRQKGAVFILWGKPARDKCSSINRTRHRVIESSHPSPLSNTKTATPFTGSSVFSRANALLGELGWGPVDWNL